MLSRCKKFIAVGMAAFSLLGLTACGAKKTDTSPQKTIQSVLVEAAKVAKGDISDISTVNGKIAPSEEVNVVPKTPGRVAVLPFKVGDRVHKGEVLFSLENGEFSAAVKSAQAALTVSDIGQVQAKIQYQDASKNLERMKSLYEQGAISKQQLEAAQTGLQMADPGMAAAKLRQAEAAVQTAKAQLDNTIVRSPISGIISARNVDVGEMASQTPVMTIVDIDTVIVETNITESEVNKLKIGQKVDVIVSAVGKKPFAGTITTISPVADSKSSAFPIKIKISNPGHKLKPGMFAEIKLALNSKKNVVVVSKEAVVDSGEGKYVYVVQDNKGVRKMIKTGIEDDTRVEVVSGLQAGDVIVLTGQNKLQNGTPVTLSSGLSAGGK